MTDTPYGEFDQRQLILRDRLAIDRTAMANERTLLAYVRTSLALVIVGGSLLKFFNSTLADVTGWFFIVLGVGTLIIGFAAFAGVRKRLQRVRSDVSAEESLIGAHEQHSLDH
ncbi:MAG: DUF202 domain-containing protein [Phycisphaerae bacterium]